MVGKRGWLRVGWRRKMVVVRVRKDGGWSMEEEGGGGSVDRKTKMRVGVGVKGKVRKDGVRGADRRWRG